MTLQSLSSLLRALPPTHKRDQRYADRMTIVVELRQIEPAMPVLDVADEALGSLERRGNFRLGQAR